jgi:hypothetical protein
MRVHKLVDITIGLPLRDAEPHKKNNMIKQLVVAYRSAGSGFTAAYCGFPNRKFFSLLLP